MKCQARVATSHLMLPLGFTANHFDIVSLRTNHESRMVVCVVLRAQTRCTIALGNLPNSMALRSGVFQSRFPFVNKKAPPKGGAL